MLRRQLEKGGGTDISILDMHFLVLALIVLFTGTLEGHSNQFLSH